MTSHPTRRSLAWRPLTSVLALTLALVLLAAGCGDNKDDTAKSTGTTTAGSAAKALPAAQLTLVAYSTPQEAYDKLTEAFRKTPTGQEHHVHQVLRRLRRPEPGRRVRA